ncbi:MAG: nitroreductase family protein [Nanoarchaeota archaeon]|nr:nitroreductase family protein [Nanoarchaeota archaeon]
METTDCIKKRRSVRKFMDIPLDWDVVTKIIDAARYTPTSGNLQNNKFIVVFDKGKIKKLCGACASQAWMSTAPAIIVVCSEPDKAKKFYGIRGERLYSIQNSAAAAMVIMLAACDVGLATCWVGAFDEDAVKSTLGIPGSIRPQVIIPIGYPDETPSKLPKYRLQDVLGIDRYDNKYEDLSEFTGWSSVRVEKTVKNTLKAVKKGAKKLSEKVVEKVKEIKKKK